MYFFGIGRDIDELRRPPEKSQRLNPWGATYCDLNSLELHRHTHNARRRGENAWAPVRRLIRMSTLRAGGVCAPESDLVLSIIE